MRTGGDFPARSTSAYFFRADCSRNGLVAPELAVARTFTFSFFGFLASLLPRLLLPFPIAFTFDEYATNLNPDALDLWILGHTGLSAEHRFIGPEHCVETRPIESSTSNRLFAWSK